MGIFSRLLPKKRAAELPPAIVMSKPPSPGRAMRNAARAVTRMFDAAKFDRLNGNWNAIPLPADWIITRNLRALVGRSRDQCANNDHGRAFLRLCRQNIVGPQGVVLKMAFKKADGTTLDKDTNKAIKAAWDSWGHRDNADVTGQESWRAIQAACVQSAAADGEFIVRVVTGKDAGPWGFALQVIDTMRLSVDYNEDRYNGLNFIRHGIEFNRYGRPLAYHFSTIDDGEAEYQYAGTHYIRVPADQVIHGFRKDMVGQKRGLPWTATALFRMKQLAGMEDAALINARVGAAKMGVIKWQEGYAPEFEDGEDVGNLEIDGEPGSFPVLPEGADLIPWNPQYPSGEFTPFVKTALRGIASGLGVAYNNFANDLEGVNFSSIRQGTLDEREHWKELQEWLVEGLIQPVFEKWLRYSLLAKRIKSNGLPLPAVLVDEYKAAASWQPRRWQWIDPSADVTAAVNSKNNMLTSPGKIIREWGGDPAEIWAEFGADIKDMVAAGIPMEFIVASMSEVLITPPQQTPATEPAAA